MFPFTDSKNQDATKLWKNIKIIDMLSWKSAIYFNFLKGRGLFTRKMA